MAINKLISIFIEKIHVLSINIFIHDIGFKLKGTPHFLFFVHLNEIEMMIEHTNIDD